MPLGREKCPAPMRSAREFGRRKPIHASTDRVIDSTPALAFSISVLSGSLASVAHEAIHSRLTGVQADQMPSDLSPTTGNRTKTGRHASQSAPEDRAQNTAVGGRHLVGRGRAPPSFPDYLR